MKKARIMNTLAAIACLSLSSAGLAQQVSKTEAPDSCTLNIFNKTDAPASVGTAGGNSASIRPGGQASIGASCELLKRAAASGPYKDVLAKTSEKNYNITLRSPSDKMPGKQPGRTPSVGPSKPPMDAPRVPKNPTSVPKTIKLQPDNSNNYLWISSGLEICKTPKGC